MRKLVGLAVVVSLGCDKKSDAPKPADPASAPKPAAPAPAATPPIEVTAGELYKAYADDRAAADARYEKKSLRVKGIVEDKGGMVLHLVARGGLDHVNAWFPAEGKPLAGLKKNDIVTILCKGGGLLAVPELRECAIENVEPIAAPASR